MATTKGKDSNPEKKIEVQCEGSYKVEGNIPLVRKIQVVSEYGEPLTWQKEGNIRITPRYTLCSCGHSGDKPFCDNTHFTVDFDNTETADTRPTAECQITYPGGTRIVVKYDDSLCMESGFCCTREKCIDELVTLTAETQIRSEVIAMVERCPSGALTYSIEPGQPDIEPDYPEQIAVTTEITSDGPIPGPLWVTGNIPVVRCDGQNFETRNRVTLCRCGHSKNKPLCDGSHRPMGVESIKKKLSHSHE